jgi:SWIB/MDM2 domain
VITTSARYVLQILLISGARFDALAALYVTHFAVLNILTRTSCVQALKLVWKYIKEHELQDPRNKTEILCDDKMAAITGGERRYALNTFIVSTSVI